MAQNALTGPVGRSSNRMEHREINDAIGVAQLERRGQFGRVDSNHGKSGRLAERSTSSRGGDLDLDGA